VTPGPSGVEVRKGGNIGTRAPSDSTLVEALGPTLPKQRPIATLVHGFRCETPWFDVRLLAMPGGLVRQCYPDLVVKGRAA
jgi:hypothetical protein